MRIKSTFTIVILVPLISSLVNAEDDVFLRLMKAKTIKCHLGKGASAEWKNGKGMGLSTGNLNYLNIYGRPLLLSFTFTFYDKKRVLTNSIFFKFSQGQKLQS